LNKIEHPEPVISFKVPGLIFHLGMRLFH